MSRYVKYNLADLNNRDLLIAALNEMGWTADQIEVHDEPQTLYGYHGDARKEKANVIIRRQNIDSSANDIGFVKTKDGTFQPIVSENETYLTGRKDGMRYMQRDGSATFVQRVTTAYQHVAGDAAINTILTSTIPTMKLQGLIPMWAQPEVINESGVRRVVCEVQAR